MSYFQRLAAQSRSAAAPRPVVGNVVNAGRVADIVERNVEIEASQHGFTEARPSAVDGAAMDATSDVRGGHVPSMPDAGSRAARSDARSRTNPRDHADVPEPDMAPGRGHPGFATDASVASPAIDASTLPSNDSIPFAAAMRRDRDDIVRDGVSGDPSNDSRRAFAAERSSRNPAEPQDTSAGQMSAALHAVASSATTASGQARAVGADPGYVSSGPQVVAGHSSDVATQPRAPAPGAESDQRADAIALAFSAMRAHAGRAEFDPAPQKPAPRIEVRFGRVSVDVHAAPPTPPAPVAPPVVQIVAPAAAPAFAPSRHYLRMD